MSYYLSVPQFNLLKWKANFYKIIFLSSLMLTGCLGGSNSSGDSAPKLERIDIFASPVVTKGSSELTLAKGNRQAFAAIGHYKSGETKDITNVVHWNSSDEAVATITPSGMLTGVVEGSATVTASQDGVTSNSVAASVTAAVITAIQVTPSSVSVAKRQTQQLTATATYSDST